MKKVVFILLAVVLLASYSTVSAQSDVIYAPFQDHLSDEQKSTIDKAEKKIEKAEKKKSQAKTIEKKYAKLKKKKKKAKKYEKKTWQAKQFTILAEADFEKSFIMIKDVYSEAISSATFYSKTDEDDAKALDAECEEKFSEASKKIKKYKKKKKKELKKTKSKKVNGEMQSAHKLMEEGLFKQIEALRTILSQGKKKKRDEEDLEAWNDAKSSNTIGAFNDYVSTYSDGKYVSQARIKIKEIQEAEEIEAERLANAAKTENMIFNIYSFYCCF